MDSFFKSAVCDLDKLLDEFEQNPDENNFCRTPIRETTTSDYPSHHSKSKYSADLSEANVQTAVDSLSFGASCSLVGADSLLPSTVDAKETLQQSQKTLTGLDLLSTVANRSSGDTEQLGHSRGSRPVCDLISDTESVTHETNDHEVNNELEIKPIEDQASGSLLIDFNQFLPPVNAGELECSREGNFGITSLLELNISSHTSTEKEPHNSGHFNGGIRNQEDSIQHANSDELKDDEFQKEGESPDKLSQCEQAEEFLVVSLQTKEINSVFEDAIGYNDSKIQESSDRVKSDVCADLNNVRTVASCELGDVETGLELENDFLKVRYTCNVSSNNANKVDHPNNSIISANSFLNPHSGADSTVNSGEPEQDLEPRPPQTECHEIVNSDSAQCLIMNSKLNVEPYNREMSLADEANQNLGHNSDTSLEEHAGGEENIDEKNESYPCVEWMEQKGTLLMSNAFEEAMVKPFEEIQNHVSDTETVFAAEFSFGDVKDGCDINDVLVSDAELDAFLMEQNDHCSSKESGNNPSANRFSELRAGQIDLLKTYDFLNHPEAIVAVDVSPDPQVEESLKLVHHGKESLNANIQSIPFTSDIQIETAPIPIRSKESQPVSSTDTNQVVNNAYNNQMNFGGARPKLFNSQVKVVPKQDQNNPTDDSGSVDQCAVYLDTKDSVSEKDQSTSISSTTYNYVGGTEDGTQVLGPSYDSIVCDHIGNVEEAAEQLIKEAALLGQNQPQWIPDSEAPTCARCHARFTFTKRRHHCRACGKVFCAACCNQKCKLQYLENKEARVCVVCYNTIQKGNCTREHRRGWFADGILPNGEVADPTTMTGSSPVGTGKGTPEDVCQGLKMPSSQSAGDNLLSDVTSQVDALKTDPAGSANVQNIKADISQTSYRALTAVGKYVPKIMNLIPNDEHDLPPIVTTGEQEDQVMVEQHPTQNQAMLLLQDGESNSLTFVLNANLLINMKLVNYAASKCWCFVSNGLHGVGQAEVVILLCSSEENVIPKDILNFYITLYQDASKGKTIGNLGIFSFTEGFLGSKDLGGFLFVMPTFQTLANLLIPSSPYLFGILIHKLEMPWAKVFPIRLMLRLGTEYNVYPCPLMSVRFRKALFGETGHTILNLLADLRNYQYTLPTIEGLVLHLEMGKSTIKIPKRRYSELMKVVTSSNEHVIALGMCFSLDADSHLVCIQSDDKNYQTRVNTIAGKSRRVTGASFVVFNGALKTTSGFIAKSSSVEDGLMVQVTPETMDDIRRALREKRDFQIICGKLDSDDRREFVNIQWIDGDEPINKGVLSPLDGRSMENIPSNRILQENEFETDGIVIKCTEVFYLQRNHDPHSPTIPTVQSQLSKEIATACCAALCPHLKSLKEIEINKLSLRVSLETDKVEYQAGSMGLLLPQHYMNDLDSAVIPVIHNGSSYASSGPLEMEFFFFIFERLI